MHAIQIYIDETLDEQQLADLRKSLQSIPHVSHVATHHRVPHDLLVEYEEQHVMAMDIVNALQRRGIHPDVVSC